MGVINKKDLPKAVSEELSKAALADQSQAAKKLKEIAAKAGHEVLTEKLDITDSDALATLIDGLADKHGGVGVLVNNAGITRDGLLVGSTLFPVVIGIGLAAGVQLLVVAFLGSVFFIAASWYRPSQA